MRLTRLVPGAVLCAAVCAGLSGCNRDESPPPEPPGPALGDMGAGSPDTGSEPAPPRLVAAEEFPDLAAPWTGDLDGMIARRVVRVLVPYSRTYYYIDRGRQQGLSYEAGRLLEGALNARPGHAGVGVHVVFLPAARDQLIPGLVAGHGDLAIGNLTITPERQRFVDFSIPVLDDVRELVVTGPGVPAPASLADLSGRRILVRPSSSYAESLHRLNARFTAEGRPPIQILDADERLEDGDILELVRGGLVPMTIVDEHKAMLWARIFPEIVVHRSLAVREGAATGWAFRKGSPQLARLVDAVVRKNRQGTLTGNMLLERYLGNTRRLRNAMADEGMRRFRSMTGVFRKYADRYDLDWLLVMAQAYQESGLDQSKRSAAGAVGVMQILPSTAQGPHVGIQNIRTLDGNVHAGTKYLRFLIDNYFSDPGIDRANRLLLAFAAYNAGPTRVEDLRHDARQLGLDPDVWFDNVEIIAAREIGRETVRYVSNIFKYYVAYRLTSELGRERQEVVRQAGG